MLPQMFVRWGSAQAALLAHDDQAWQVQRPSRLLGHQT